TCKSAASVLLAPPSATPSCKPLAWSTTTASNVSDMLRSRETAENTRAGVRQKQPLCRSNSGRSKSPILLIQLQHRAKEHIHAFTAVLLARKLLGCVADPADARHKNHSNRGNPRDALRVLCRPAGNQLCRELQLLGGIRDDAPQSRIR